KFLRNQKRSQVIVAGIETHVCVYQTVADLLIKKFEVTVVCDAVSSRSSENRQIALDRMKTLGAYLTSMEMMVCELLRGAGHPKFKEVLSLIK
ncbi:MAG: isochorismatase family protein, partial [Candidatus Omnitrophica bacterium]|nr:isochorismatase family protein [Candidatus Omnitrophota bacterium]